MGRCQREESRWEGWMLGTSSSIFLSAHFLFVFLKRTANFELHRIRKERGGCFRIFTTMLGKEKGNRGWSWDERRLRVWGSGRRGMRNGVEMGGRLGRMCRRSEVKCFYGGGKNVSWKMPLLLLWIESPIWSWLSSQFAHLQCQCYLRRIILVDCPACCAMGQCQAEKHISFGYNPSSVPHLISRWYVRS